MEKILLDTDIGNDIDDSICLAYLLCQRNCDLLGITTVTGEPVERAKQASAICKAVGRDDIPIYPGAEHPLITSQKQGISHQKRFLDRWPHENEFPNGEAIEFMRQTIRSNPGEVILLGIGPLTNIALLFCIDAEIPFLLKELVLMNGVFFTYSYKGQPCLSEWNARCDPHAAAIVYQAPVSNIRAIGLDVTSIVTLEKESIVSNFNDGILKTVFDFSGIDNNSSHSITFHDPLAATTIFNKELCIFERGNVDIEFGSKHIEGLTRFTLEENGKCEVAISVDKGKFFEHYFTVTKSE